MQEKVPRFGNSEGKSSKVWKFWAEKFQGLEVLGGKVPRPPPTDVGPSLAPIAIGAGLEIGRQKVPKFENFGRKSPSIGSCGRKSSRLWKSCRKSFKADPILIGGGFGRPVSIASGACPAVCGKDNSQRAQRREDSSWLMVNGNEDTPAKNAMGEKANFFPQLTVNNQPRTNPQRTCREEWGNRLLESRKSAKTSGRRWRSEGHCCSSGVVRGLLFSH